MNRFINRKAGNFNGLTIAITGGYGWGMLYFIKNHLRYLILNNWEIVLGYVCFMGLLGFVAVSLIRSNDGTKQTTRVAAELILRITALIFVYNSSASPSASLALSGSCLLGYVLQTLLTPKSKRNDKKTK